MSGLRCRGRSRSPSLRARTRTSSARPPRSQRQRERRNLPDLRPIRWDSKTSLPLGAAPTCASTPGCRLRSAAHTERWTSRCRPRAATRSPRCRWPPTALPPRTFQLHCAAVPPTHTRRWRAHTQLGQCSRAAPRCSKTPRTRRAQAQTAESSRPSERCRCIWQSVLSPTRLPSVWRMSYPPAPWLRAKRLAELRRRKTLVPGTGRGLRHQRWR
mmetsp:Transcript_6297/g.10530  ORF Transcript_6297/g.10530 Transcript_6297/m.10530 type:complete len:214 (+) Transcript_6297:592-1233(+)